MQSSFNQYSRGKVDEVMFIAVICQEYGWTYQEYMSQPIWFIELLRQKMIIDSKNHEMSMKKLRK
jgi:hypothetical protein